MYDLTATEKIGAQWCAAEELRAAQGVHACAVALATALVVVTTIVSPIALLLVLL